MPVSSTTFGDNQVNKNSNSAFSPSNLILYGVHGLIKKLDTPNSFTMAQDKLSSTLSSIQSEHPSVKLYTPESPDFDDLNKTYIISQAKPAAIALPQTADDVQALVRTCVRNGLDFNVRTGGHNCVGRTLVDGALLIDMRDIAGVNVSEDKKTAKVGGGILAWQVAS